MFMYGFFFFSSRRRHTRWPRDWSSDVCSSDLGLFNAGQLGCWMGRYEEARAYLEESLEIARGIGDKGRIAQVLQPLGMASLGQGDSAAARQYLNEGLALE